MINHPILPADSQAPLLDREELAKLSNPPGGILIWIFILAEIVFFAILFGVAARVRITAPDIFKSGQTHLDLRLGTFFTITLLLSGWQMAESVHNYDGKHFRGFTINYFFAILFGSIFVVSKIFDFYSKIKQGLTLGTNDFWDAYWLLTGFHLVHVLIGLAMMVAVYFHHWKQTLKDGEFAIRGSANYWHMCDLIWLFLFPLFFVRS